jgi:LPXTG-motif cell wall-anchored protein
VLAAGLASVGFVLAGPGGAGADGDVATSDAPAAISKTVDTAECGIISSNVDGGTASFTVGPAGCEGVVGPVSFSTFDLPNGMREPFEAQTLIAHAAGNGQTYSSGTHELTATLGDACNWQSDLYVGESSMPPFGGSLLAYDFREGRDCTSPPTEIEPCTLTDASVVAGVVSFTIGPEDCEGSVGPLSFSAFELPGGLRVPFEEQELIAHHPDNGSMYPEGTYTLTLELGDACNWQADLYWGESRTPVFGDDLIVADYREGETCIADTTTTTTEVSGGGGGGGGDTTTTTTEVSGGGGDGGETTTTTTADDVDNAGPTPTTTDSGQAGGATTTTQTGGGGGGRTLPRTGPADMMMTSLLGGVLIGLGGLARRAARA